MMHVWLPFGAPIGASHVTRHAGSNLFSREQLCGFSRFSGDTCSGDRCRGGCAQVADLEEQPHGGIQGDPLVACQGQHLTTGRDTPGRKEVGVSGFG